MNENEKAGKRVHVTSKSGQIDLGLGTYLFLGEILLDTGKKIQATQCAWKIVPARPAPPFKITLTKRTRVFEGATQIRVVPQIVLIPGTEITIEKLEKREWNHGNYVVGIFRIDTEPYALVMSEVKLPEEKVPFLRVVK